ncbi:MAG: DUF262 domain-containing protein [Nitrospira sp.]|nr:DUF262 domain-containing protein [Nitrospira sp.]MDH4242704.1 DUF262 domain-containing protein [Nitrospira sp.]MDH4355027.1 DUF262 domain-containing protein [Nitrospira sp.]MDH5316987.1 DUF262 domain-containing protein [Nitrospira sp.]
MDRVDYESVVIQDLLNFYSRQELNITPWYQRRAVWNQPQKAYLINTVHEKKPVPSIYIRHTIDLDHERSIKEVVDGQQRVRCFIEYKEDKFPAPHPNHKKHVKYSDLSKEEKTRFLLTALSVGYLVNATDGDVIEIFARINSVAKTLNPQEKRNAQFSGEFKRFTLKEAVDRLPFWRRFGIFTDNDISRMAEVQFASDLVMNLREGLQDFSAPRLTTYYRTYDEEFPDQDLLKKRLERIYSQLLEQGDHLKGTIFCRPQILFSLMLILDKKGSLPKQKVEQCITDLDSKFEAVRSGDTPSALTTDVYEAFSSGNMHRIKYRKKRDAVIKRYLA